MFNRATVKLSVQYTLLALGLVWLISLGVLLYMNRSFEGDYLQGLATGNEPSSSREDTVRADAIDRAADASLDRLEQGLIIINSGLLVIIPLTSYWLARSTLRPIQRSYEAQQEFADNASHELRTPLSVLSGELELALMKPRTPEAYRDTINAGLHEARSLTELTDKLLILARNDEARIRSNFEHIELADLVAKVVASYKPLATKRHIKLEQHAKEAWVLGSSVLVGRAIANLIDNAIKFAPDNSEIKISVTEAEDSARIEIHDAGPGLTPAESRQAFNRFWRSDASRTSPGHGLGLSITQRIVKLHDGRSWLEPGVNGGTLAVISIPLSRAG